MSDGITFPGAPVGFNGRLSAKNYGSWFVRVDEINSGLSIIGTEDEGRDLRTFYPSRRTSGSFSLLLVFKDEAERDAFNRWIRGYGRRRSTPGYAIAPMRVQVPVRNWDKTAVPASERGPVAVYGADVGDLALRLTLNFVGARDPLDLSEQLGDEVSFYQAPWATEAVDARYFYPSGTQLGGEAYGRSVNYDLDAESAAARAARETSRAEPPRGGQRWGRGRMERD